MAFFVVVLIYAVAITNSLTEQLAKRMTVDTGMRMLVSFGVVLILNLIFLMGRHITIKVMGFLFSADRLFPVCLAVSDGQLAAVASDEPDGLRPAYVAPVWISIPVMVFAFSHTPIISTFAVDRREIR